MRSGAPAGVPDTAIPASGASAGSPAVASPPWTTLRPETRLPVARYRFTLRMQDELRLPVFAGSLLRGEFGAALRRTACATGARVCEGCALLRNCPYPWIFETPAPETHELQRFSNVPNPYVIEPPSLDTRRIDAGDALEFGVVLIGRALHEIPLIVHSIARAFGRGIGKTRAKGRIERIVCETTAPPCHVWDAAASRIVGHEAALAMPQLPSVEAATLEIATPLRLQHQGRPLGADALRPRTLFTALLRRASLLFDLHAKMGAIGGEAKRLAALAERLSDERSLRWFDWKRFSSRQRQEMTLGGVVGTWTLRGDLAPLLPWLWLGQWLHVGKNATMGMGAYRLVLDGGGAR